MRTQPDTERTATQIVIVSTIALFIIFGIRLSFSVFFAEFVSAEGWSREAAAGIFSASMLTFAFVSTPAGMLLDRWGPRVVFSTGALFLAAGLFLSSMTNSIAQLMLTYGVVGGTGLAIVGLGPMAANIARWITLERRGVAIGIAFAGTGIGSLLFVPMSNWLIANNGWRGAYQVLALICLVILVPLMLLGQKTPPSTHNESSDQQHSFTHIGEIVQQTSFWWLVLLAFTAIGPVRALSVHQVAYLEEVGIERGVAAIFVGIAGLVAAAGFIGWGYLSDRLGRGRIFVLGAVCLLMAVGVLLVLRQSDTVLLLGGYSLLFGLGEGSRSGQTTAIASDVFVGERLGFVTGVVGTMFGLGAAFAPWLVGYLRDSTGDYAQGMNIVIVLVIVSIFGALMLSRQIKSKH